MTSLVTDWYFARCAQLPDADQDQLLRSLQRIRTTSLDPYLVRASVRWIRIADRRVSTYAVPSLVHLVGSTRDRGVRDEAVDALIALVGEGRSAASEAARDLVDAIAEVSASRGEERLEAALAAERWGRLASQALRREPPAERTPYFSVSQTVPVVVLLSTALELARTDNAVRDDLQARLDVARPDDGDDLNAVLARCAAGRYGRLPLLLSVELQACCGDRDGALAAIAGERRRSVDGRHEPDLIDARAKLTGLTSAKLIEELVEGAQLQRVRDRGGFGAPTASFRRRVGLGDDEDVDLFMAVTWQVAVLGFAMVQGGPLANRLADVLAMADGSQPIVVDLTKGPRSGRRNDTGRARRLQELKALASLGGGPPIETEGRADSWAQVARAVAAPWIVPTHDGGSETSAPGYRARPARLALMRTCALVAAGCEALGQLGGRLSKPSAEAVLSMVLHGSSVVKQWSRLDGPRQSCDSLLAAACSATADLTSGRMAKVDPGSLVALVERMDEDLGDEEETTRADWVDDLLAARMWWIEAAAPRLDQRGLSGRWADHVEGVLEWVLGWTGPDRIEALALNDLLTRLGAPAVEGPSSEADPWSVLVARPEPPTFSEILVAPNGRPDEWAADRPDLDDRARLARAVRRVEAASPDDDLNDLVDEVVDAAARALDGGTTDLHLVVRIASLLGLPSLQSCPDSALQIAVISTSSNEPAVWRTTFAAARPTLDPGRGLAQPAGQLVLVGLRRLQDEEDEELRERLGAIWREHSVALVTMADDDLRHSIVGQLVGAADLHGIERARTGATLVAVDERGQQHHLSLRSDPSARDVGRVRALVLDPVRSNHGAWVEHPSSSAADACALGTLRAQPAGQGRLLRFLLSGTTFDVDPRLWDADASLAFAAGTEDDVALHGAPGIDPSEDRLVVGVRRGGEWTPWVRSAEALVLELAARGPGASTTLVYNGTGPRGFLLSTRSGEQYEVLPADFATDDADRFEDEVAKVEDPVGLLVTVCLNGSGAVRLAESAPVGSVHRGIQVPFDRRNLEWRSALASAPDVLALERVGGDLGIGLAGSPPGFPDRLLVALGAAPGRGVVLVLRPEFGDEAQRTGRVTVEIARPHGELRGDRAELIRELWEDEAEVVLDWTMGSTLSDRSKLNCVTKSGYVVNVALEALSLVPVRIEGLRSQVDVEGRSALVRCYRRDAREVRADASSLPPEARSLVEAAVVPVRGVVWRSLADQPAAVIVLEGLEDVEMAIDLQERVRVGNRILIGPGVESDGTVCVEVQAPAREAYPLWDASGRLAEGAVYVGQLGRGIGQGVAQLAPGRLAIFDSDRSTTPFARFERGEWQAGPDWANCKVERPTNGTKAAHSWVSANGLMVSGTTTKALEGGPAELRGATVVVYGTRSATVRRELLVEQRARARTRRPGAASAPSTEDRPAVDRLALLERLLEAGDPLAITVVGRPPQRATIEILQQEGCSAHDALVAIIEGESALVSAANYDRAGLGVLVRTDEGEVRLSLDETPAFDVAQYRAELRVDLEVEIEIPSLYYVKQDDEGRHVFEFGWGQRLAAPADQLRWDGGPFEALEKVLFHGDQVEAATFIEDPDGTPVMDIRSTRIQRGVGHRLYLQARDQSFVHLVRVVAEGDDLRVAQIDGFDDTSPETPSVPYRGRRVWHAVLDEASKSALREDGLPEEGRTIYARLQVGRFEETLGTELQYSMVRVGRDQHAESVVTFVKGGVIKPLGNQLVLEVGSATGDDSDLKRNLYISRRRFSADVNQLPRVRRLERANALDGALLIAWVGRDEQGKVVAQLQGRIPCRKIETLQDLARSGDIVLVVDAVSDDHVRLEYRHGIAFELRGADLVDRPARLSRGDVVRTILQGDRFRLEVCSLSDTQFFRRAPRPLVVLPTNPLFSKDAATRGGEPAFWAKLPNRMTFFGGGLPGVAARPASRGAGREWGAPKASEMAELMRRRHPKIGWFGYVGQQLRLVPDEGSAPVAAVRFDDTGRPHATVAGRPVEVDPSILTFGDQASSELAVRARKMRWQYHDEGTARWREDGKVDWEDLGPHSLERGPVFASKDGRLRYYHDELPRSSFPSGFLAEGVEHRGKPFDVAVAGMHLDQAGVIDGLYLEVVPGLVCLVLAPLLQLRLSQEDHLSLSHVALSSFGIGDTLTLQIAETATRSVDTIDVVGWSPSDRVILGPVVDGGDARDRARLVAPVRSFDPDVGRLDLGAGRVSVVIPTYREPSTPLVRLSADNSVEATDGLAVRKGDVILVGLAADRFIVHGADGYEAVPKLKPGGSRWVGPDLRPGFRELKATISGLGGAMAATCAFVDRNRRLIGFSFDRQSISAAPGASVLARVVGEDGSGNFLLQAGPEIVPVRADRVVAGASSARLAPLADALRESGAIVRLVQGADEPQPVPLRAREGQVARTFGIVGIEARNANGIVVREAGTLALAWIPAAHLALAATSRADWDEIWVSSGRLLRATPIAQGRGGPRGAAQPPRAATSALSVLEHEPVRVERARLRVGQSIDVELVARAHAGDHLLGLTANGTILAVRPRRLDDWTVGDQITAVVQEHADGWRQVVAVPKAERSVDLGLQFRPFSPGSPGAPVDLATDLADDPVRTSAEAVSDATELARMLTDKSRSSAPAATADLVVVALVLLHHLTLSDEELRTAGAIKAEGELLRARARWDAAVDPVLSSLGRRALQSLHLEALERHWRREREHLRGAIWRHLDRLAPALAGPCSPATVQNVVAVANDLSLAGGIHGRYVAAALRTAVGDSRSAGTLLSDPDLQLPAIAATARLGNSSLVTRRLGAGDARTPTDPKVRRTQRDELLLAYERLRRDGSASVLVADLPWFAVRRTTVGSPPGRSSRRRTPRSASPST